MEQIIFGIDVGGSAIKGAPVDVVQGEMTAERLRILTPKPSTPDACIGVMKEILEDFSWKGPVGVGMPGIVKNNVMLSAANIDHGWIGLNVREHIAENIGHDVYLCNDADAAGLCEVEFGIGQGEKGLVMVITLGTGIGTALFYRGRLIPNTELGHIYMRNREEGAERFVAESARQRDGITWEEYGRRMQEYLAYLEFLFSPDVFILGGGGAKNFAEFSQYLRLRTRVVTAEKLNKAGIVGAALYARHAMEGWGA